MLTGSQNIALPVITAPIRPAVLLTDTQKYMQQLNGVAIASETDSNLEDAERRVAEMAEQVELYKKDLTLARKEAKQANQAAVQTQEQADFDAQQARRAIKQSQESAASAQAQIIQEAQQEFARAVEAACKNDSKGLKDAGQSVAALVGEIEDHKKQTQLNLERAASVIVEDTDVMVKGHSSAIKWVMADREGGQLRATYEARQKLTEILDGQPLNVLTILGGARKGKSFVMNALTGCEDVFRVTPDVVPCTEGADLSPFLMSLSDFKQGGGTHSDHRRVDPSQPTIAFVDMEGQGDKSTEHGVRLATTFLVVSKARAACK